MASEVIFSLQGKRVWVAGHRGMVGSAIVRRLASEGCEIITAGRDAVDLVRQDQVDAWMAENRPDAIFLAAAKVGGILANDSFPADFIYENLMIEANIIAAAHKNDVAKLLFLGSSCIYPKMAPQPITEDALLTGPLEPTNLYGPGDNFDLLGSHVLPALIRKAHEAKQAGAESITLWGTGTPRREFLYVDDCADACVHLMKTYSAETHVNIGSGEDLTILELAEKVCEIIGFQGEIIRDATKPDGTPRKLMSAAKLRAMGWTPKVDLDEGIARTYEAFLSVLG
jgi:GDP-L-fucose synthase